MRPVHTYARTANRDALLWLKLNCAHESDVAGVDLRLVHSTLRHANKA